MPLLSKQSVRNLNETVRRVKNLPAGRGGSRKVRKPEGRDYPYMAINRTGDSLKIGYIVEITAFDGDKNLFSIQKPSGDDLANVAVVLTPAEDGRMVALSFSGPHMLWADCGSEVPPAWGSTNGSYRAKEGTTFLHLASTSFLSDTDRVCACFAGSGLYIEDHTLTVEETENGWTLCSKSTRSDGEEFGNCVNLNEMIGDGLGDDYVTNPTHVYAKDAAGNMGWVAVASFTCPLP